MVSPYGQEDLQDCAALFLDVFTNEPWNYGWMTREAALRYFTDMAVTPGFVGMVYRVGDEIVGLCMGMLSDYFTPLMYDIKELAVRRGEQRKGHGTRMMAEMEAHLKDMGVTTVTLLTQRTIPAFGFYARQGYDAAEHSVFMSKAL